jgi:anaerobic magnesium-protoporphyrin IX monomethyl ester cyclase
MMQLSSILKLRGHTVGFLLTEDVSEEDIVARVRQFEPQVLAYSIMTGEHNYHINLNAMIRSQYDCFSIFGGPHPTFKPDMIEMDKVDAICRGEGDIAFPELLDRMERGADFSNVPNLWIRKPDGTIVRNDLGPLVEDLDELPFPDRELLYDAEPFFRFRGMRLFMAARGCPYRCSYCFNHAYNRLTKDKGRLLRTRSVGNVLLEIRRVKEKYFTNCVWIDDDTFLLKPKGWLEEFAERYPKEIGIPLFLNGRANLIPDNDTGRLLQRMGCRTLCLGVECGNEQVANDLLKRNLDNQEIVNACEILHKCGIQILTQNLVGLPVDDPLKTDLETLDLNIRLRPYLAHDHLLYPYPETEVGEVAIKRGLFDSNFEKVFVTVKIDSVLNFHDPALRRKLVNLHKIFSLVVQFPFLRRFVDTLISLPLTPMYTWLYFAFCGYKVITMSGLKGFVRVLPRYVLFYLRMVPRLERRVVFRTLAEKHTYPQRISH